MRTMGCRHIFRVVVLLCAALSLFPAVDARAKSNARISGSILSNSGNPLGDAIIKIYREMRQGEAVSVARSDSRGFFRAVLAPGTYYLQVSHQGYQPVTTAKFAVDASRTVSLDIILQDIITFISNEDDPRNWDLKSVMRSTSDRRLIFRIAPEGDAEVCEDGDPGFYRSGAMSLASSTSLGSESYLIGPQASQDGVSSNFAFTEPVGPRSRMILSGQMDYSFGSFWRVRDTYNYRPDNDHDYRISVGYGRMNVSYPQSSSLSSQVLSQEFDPRESAVETLAVGLEGKTKYLDLLTVKYGFDYSHLNDGTARSFLYPSVQFLLTPTEKWSLQTSVTSQRMSDLNTIVLPDGELLNLSEPTLITVVDSHVTMSQIRHSEFSALRTLTPDTTLEFAVYQDSIQGPGLPLMVTTITPLQERSHVIEMNEDHSSQKGMRITVKRKITENLSGSVGYVYGDAASISNTGPVMSSEQLDGSLANFVRQRYQHSITGGLRAIVPVTKTNILATVRWYSGNLLTPADWFSDRMEIGTKSANLEIRQAVPLPEFWGTTGRWEILVDLRNILDQGRMILATSDGEIVLNRNPRSLRFGLNLNFR